MPDALAIVERMTEADFADFRGGLKQERAKQFAGEEWAKRFGALLMPDVLIDASLIAMKMHAPLGTVLLSSAIAKTVGVKTATVKAVRKGKTTGLAAHRKKKR